MACFACFRAEFWERSVWHLDFGGVAKWCFVEVFERGFGNGLRGIWVSEGVAKCCVFCVFSSGYWERSAGSLGILRGVGVLAKRCFSGFWDRVLERFL